MKKILVITGGSRGIGLACVQRFLAEGFLVVNLSRQQPPVTGITHMSVDLADINWPQHCTQQLQSLLANADSICIIHNAALLAKDSIRDVAAASLQQVLQLNVVAATQLNQIVLPFMRATSAILYVASTLGEKAVANSCSYVTSKHAQIGLMKSTCQDLFGSGIHTAAICPGFTDTEMLRAHVGNSAEVLDYFAAESAFGRLLQPEEIADTLWFCAQTPALNGAVIHANLGQKEH